MTLNTKEHYVKGKTFKTRVTCDFREGYTEDVTCGTCGVWLRERNADWIGDVPYCKMCAPEDL